MYWSVILFLFVKRFLSCEHEKFILELRKKFDKRKDKKSLNSRSGTLVESSGIKLISGPWVKFPLAVCGCKCYVYVIVVRACFFIYWVYFPIILAIFPIGYNSNLKAELWRAVKAESSQMRNWMGSRAVTKSNQYFSPNEKTFFCW